MVKKIILITLPSVCVNLRLQLINRLMKQYIILFTVLQYIAKTLCIVLPDSCQYSALISISLFSTQRGKRSVMAAEVEVELDGSNEYPAHYKVMMDKLNEQRQLDQFTDITLIVDGK